MKNKIGIWGLGTTGKSVIKYLFDTRQEGDYLKLEVTDKKDPNNEDLNFLRQYKVKYTPSISQFLETNEFIIPSPGIDLRTYSKYNYKFLSELDLFAQAWQKPIIAVTGTVGKTSIVYLLSKIFEQNNIKVSTGGNIGTGMLDLVKEQEKSEYALLEVSSFQLDTCKTFGPNLAIITNLYPNHLDRHENLDEYFKAKYKIIANQTIGQKALVPIELREQLQQEDINRSFIYFSQNAIDTSKVNLKPEEYIYFIENNKIVKFMHGEKREIIDIKELPTISYKANWLIIVAACDILQIDLNILKNIIIDNLPAHRLDRVAQINGLTFYNDSKSTIPQATLAAIDQINSNNITLFLGGISKGVDRTELIYKLKTKVDSVVCFGGEADNLYQLCKKNKIISYNCKTLTEAFNTAINNCKTGQILLFSPAGASFDLFKNYQDRGDNFVKLVKEYEMQLARKNLCKN